MSGNGSPLFRPVLLVVAYPGRSTDRRAPEAPRNEAGRASEVVVRSSPGWPILASVLLSCSLFACEESRPPPLGSRAVGPAASWCNAMCSTYRRCQSAPWPSCLNDCQAQNRTFLARNSTASIELQTECIQLASCTADMNELLDECFVEAFFALEPSAESSALCAAMAKPFFECSWFSTPQSCSTFHAVFSAPALAAEQDCAAASCDELDACIEAQLYSFGE